MLIKTSISRLIRITAGVVLCTALSGCATFSGARIGFSRSAGFAVHPFHSASGTATAAPAIAAARILRALPEDADRNPRDLDKQSALLHEGLYLDRQGTIRPLRALHRTPIAATPPPATQARQRASTAALPQPVALDVPGVSP